MMIPGIMAQRRQSGGAPALWTPLNMATVPQIYLDAQDSVVTDVGGACSAISNLGAMGSAGDFSQATAANRPTILATELNGQRVLRFDGANDVLTAGTASARALFRNAPAAWVFSVHKKRATDAAPVDRALFYSLNGVEGWRVLVLCGSSAGAGANKNTFQAVRLDNQVAGSLSAPSAKSGAYMTAFSVVNFQTAAAALRENGAEVAASAALTIGTGNTSDSSPSGPLALGAFSSGVIASDVDVAALIASNAQPSADDVQRLEGWAAHKYGLTANLPANHPYKTAAPTV